MGVVYKGFDPKIRRPVAIKTISEKLLIRGDSHDFLERFESEVVAVGRLSHSNIVAIYEYSVDGAVPFFAMEYVEGQELNKYVKQRTVFELERALKITSQVLDALGYAHENKVIHRDIKPGNVILLDNDRAKITGLWYRTGG